MKSDTKTKKHEEEKVMSKKTQKLFEKYYLQFRENLYWYVYRRIGQQQAAEDITADVFVKLLENENILNERDENGIRAWLFTVARNQMIDSFRKRSNKAQKVELDEEIFEIVGAKDDEQIQALIKEDQAQLLFSLLESLDTDEKEIVHMRFYEDMKFAEIAEIIGKKEGAVKMALYRAMEKIKTLSGDRFDVM